MTDHTSIAQNGGGLVERLRGIADDYEAHSDMAVVLYGSADEIDRCHARLEIDHVWQMEEGGQVRVDVPYDERASIPDGIECRNETIKLLDQNIATLRANATALEHRLEQALGALREIGEIAVPPDELGSDWHSEALMLGEKLDRIHTLAKGPAQ